MVASADILLDGQLEDADDLQIHGEIVLFSISSNVSYGSKHGVVITSKDDSIKNILYQPSEDELDSYGVSESINLMAGLVWFQPKVAESLLKLHCLSPIDGCTYMGADSGEESIRMSLYYDLLPASCSGVTKQEFIEGRCGKALLRGRSSTPLMATARKQVWNELKRYRAWNCKLNGLSHKYLPVWESFDHSEITEQWSKMAEFSSVKCAVFKNCQDIYFIDSLYPTLVTERGFVMNYGLDSSEVLIM